jgi:hypothetical protein
LEREVERPAKRAMEEQRFETEGEGDEVEGGGAKKQKTEEDESEVEWEEGRNSKKQKIEQIGRWIQQERMEMGEEEDADEEEWREAWDDVRGGSLKLAILAQGIFVQACLCALSLSLFASRCREFGEGCPVHAEAGAAGYVAEVGLAAGNRVQDVRLRHDLHWLADVCVWGLPCVRPGWLPSSSTSSQSWSSRSLWCSSSSTCCFRILPFLAAVPVRLDAGGLVLPLR